MNEEKPQSAGAIIAVAFFKKEDGDERDLATMIDSAITREARIADNEKWSLRMARDMWKWEVGYIKDDLHWKQKSLLAKEEIALAEYIGNVLESSDQRARDSGAANE